MATLRTTQKARPAAASGELFCTVCRNARFVITEGPEDAVAKRCDACFRVCPTCGGAGVLFRNDWTGAVVSRVCECRKLDQRIGLYNDAAVPRRYVNATLEDFDARQNESLANASLALLRLVKDFAPGRRGIGLSGPVGCGKTHLMAALVRDLTLKSGVETVFVEFTHLLAAIRASYDRQQGDGRVMEPLIEAPVLIIDELGKGLSTEWQMAILDELISKRYNRSVTTCFTTNFPLRDRNLQGARTRDNFDAVLLEERIGARIFSRLTEMCEFHRIDADDFRKRPESP
jgi:DNA replication protein DnaC